VVTARARPERLLQTPISVQSFSAAKLTADGVNDLNTLQFEAGFTFNSQGASYSGGGREFPTLIFRGLATNLSSFIGGSSGAMFVDGIYVSGGAASVTLADVSSVDVLKGPQNVYFGKNTFGGAVNLITSNPSENYQGKFSVGYSSMGSYDDTLSVEGAIIPGLLTGRITGELMHQGAQYTAADGGPLGEQDTKGVTVVLYATPTPDTWLRTRFHYSYDNDSEAAEGFLEGSKYGTPCPGLINPYFCNNTLPTLATINPKSVLSGTVVPKSFLTQVADNNFGGVTQPWLTKVPGLSHMGLSRDNLQGSVSGGAKLPFDSTFQFNAGYNQASALDLNGADHTQDPFFITNTATIERDFEADARIVSSPSQPLRGVLGVNYFSSVNQLSQQNYYFGFDFGGSPINEEDKTEAVYGSLDYDILHNLTITGELRYQRDTVSDTVAGVGTVAENSDHALPRVILKYSPYKTTNVYLSYSEGVQPPQLETAYVTAQGLAATSGHNYLEQSLASYGVSSDFLPDPTVDVWEAGWKQSLFDNHANFSVDYYDEEWDHAQVSTFIFDPKPPCNTAPLGGTTYQPNLNATCPLGSGGQGIVGLATVHIRGIEFEGNARFTSKFSAHAAFNWTDSIRKNYDDNSWYAAFTSGVVPNQDGKRTDLVPEYQGEADATYKDHLTGPYDWYAHGVVTYTGPQYIEAVDIGQIQGYYRVNLSAGVTKGNLSFEAYITNLLDDKNWDMAVRFPSPYNFFSEAYPGAIVQAPNPRNIGFKISGKF
jgi:iron complex outermembrane receptor protein